MTQSQPFDRDSMLDTLDDGGTWDVVIVGGGATGLGTAVDAASRGYRTVLLEAADFAQGTSSRSTKLVHGGVRYLRQGNISLVVESLRERGRLRRNAPHLVSDLAFIVPAYDWWEGPFYGVGLKLYDALAGKLGLGPSVLLNRDETLQRLPTLEPDGLHGGVQYHDGQFDDARLAITLAQTAASHGAVVINRMKVVGFERRRDLICGVIAVDGESGREFKIAARVVINATGIFSDTLRRMDDPEAATLIRPSQGIHLVLPQRFAPTDHAIMVPHTSDGRVLFAVPWHDRVLLGTTDTAVDAAVLEPKPLEHEVDYLLEYAARYLDEDPGRDDVLSAFAGLRPLVAPGGASSTAEISRDHHLEVTPSGLVTVAGGKWTTYRAMAEEVVDLAAAVADLPTRACETAELRLHGWSSNPQDGTLGVYGSEMPRLGRVLDERPEWRELLDPDLPYLRGEIVWAVRHEMARSVDDVLARRTRSLILDARATGRIAAEVARIAAAELGRDRAWIDAEIRHIESLVANHLC